MWGGRGSGPGHNVQEQKRSRPCADGLLPVDPVADIKLQARPSLYGKHCLYDTQKLKP